MTPPKSKVAKVTNQMVKLADIILPDEWNREKLGDLKELVASLSTEGQIVPLVVRPSDTPGKVILVDGRRRLAAMQKLKWVEVSVSYSDAKDDGEAYMKSLIANEGREANTPYERALSIHRMVTVYGYTNERVAKAYGKTAGFVSQHLAVMKASKKLQTALRKGAVPLSVFRHFAKIDATEDEVIYARLTDMAISGTSAQSIGDKIDIYVAKKQQKAQLAAQKSGDKAPAKPAKRGAAAHKPKKAPGPQVAVIDYDDKEVQKMIKPLQQKELVERAKVYNEELIEASTPVKQAYAQGKADGFEEALGLVEYS